MKIIIEENYDELCRHALDDLLAIMEPVSHPLVCVASGDSPKGLYQQLTDRVHQKQVDVSAWNFVGLDEWVGMNGNDEGSCKFHLDNQLFKPLKIEKERQCFFDGRAEDVEAECQRIENFIAQHNGIEAAIVGLGLNGHVGMNEPGSSAKLHAHISEIDPHTQAVGQKYFTSPQSLTHGLTMGIGNLLEAKNVFIIVSGKHKAAIVNRILNEVISETVPATLLRNHTGLVLYVDKDAASLITSHNDK
ncbi:MAG: glucosamine-6-phosphate deaminase [Chitinophagaceae bacterium]|nr:glucosamine-6-phosphate deaminase [Chitinophagaceae bacterium]